MPYADAVLIRQATPGDTGQLIRVAARHNQPPIHGPALIAEVDGVARAALELADGRVVTDPFVPTADLVVLLRLLALTVGRVSAPGAGKPPPSSYLIPGLDDPTSSSNPPARLPRASEALAPA